MCVSLGVCLCVCVYICVRAAPTDEGHVSPQVEWSVLAMYAVFL